MPQSQKTAVWEHLIDMFISNLPFIIIILNMKENIICLPSHPLLKQGCLRII